MLNVLNTFYAINLKFNQISFFEEMKPDPFLMSRGISVFSHGKISYFVKTFDKINSISISAKRFPVKFH
jgi:hypothetical protein